MQDMLPKHGNCVRMSKCLLSWTIYCTALLAHQQDLYYMVIFVNCSNVYVVPTCCTHALAYHKPCSSFWQPIDATQHPALVHAAPYGGLDSCQFHLLTTHNLIIAHMHPTMFAKHLIDHLQSLICLTLKADKHIHN